MNLARLPGILPLHLFPQSIHIIAPHSRKDIEVHLSCSRVPPAPGLRGSFSPSSCSSSLSSSSGAAAAAFILLAMAIAGVTAGQIRFERPIIHERRFHVRPFQHPTMSSVTSVASATAVSASYHVISDISEISHSDSRFNIQECHQ